MIKEEVRPQKSIEFRAAARRHRRAGIGGIFGDIADKKSIIRGVVSDISQGGFKMSDVPSTTVFEKHIYTAILSKNSKTFKMLVTPRWRGTIEGDVGFKIMDASWEWVAFTREMISENDYDLFHDEGYQA